MTQTLPPRQHQYTPEMPAWYRPIIGIPWSAGPRAKRPPANVMRHLAQQDAQLQRLFDTASRNDPCPCGSGRKFKHCHGK